MDTLACSNSDINQEAIREKYQLGSIVGSNYGEHLAIISNREKESGLGVPSK